MILFGAVLPVLSLGSATLYWKSPWYQHATKETLANTISDACGIVASIESVQTLSPNRIRVNKIQFKHPETFEVLLNAPYAIAERVGGQWMVQVEMLEISMGQLQKVASVAHDRFLCRADDRLAPMQIMVKAATLGDETSIPISRIEAIFVPKPQRSSLQISIQPTKDAQNTIDMRFARIREDVNLRTTIELATHEFNVPVHFLASLFPTIQELGPAATFSGNVVCDLGQDHRMMIRKAVLRGVAFERLTKPLHYQISGQGEIYIDEAVVLDRKLSSLGGIITSTAGNINSDWLQKASSLLGMRMREGALKGAGITKPFTRLDLVFGLNEHGILIHGNLPPPQSGLPSVVLCDADGPLLFEPSQALSLMQPIQWLAAKPDVISTSSVTSAAYQSPQQASPASPVAAYLMTTLPIQDTTNR